MQRSRQEQHSRKNRQCQGHEGRKKRYGKKPTGRAKDSRGDKVRGEGQRLNNEVLLGQDKKFAQCATYKGIHFQQDYMIQFIFLKDHSGYCLENGLQGVHVWEQGNPRGLLQKFRQEKMVPTHCIPSCPLITGFPALLLSSLLPPSGPSESGNNCKGLLCWGFI